MTDDDPVERPDDDPVETGYDQVEQPGVQTDAERDDGSATGPGMRPTVTVGGDGYDPRAAGDAEQGTTAGLENAIPDADDAFDWRGWLLVSVLAVCLLGLPVLVTLRPVRVVGFRATYLVLPLVPAFVLGATAVWVAVRSRQGGR